MLHGRGAQLVYSAFERFCYFSQSIWNTPQWLMCVWLKCLPPLFSCWNFCLLIEGGEPTSWEANEIVLSLLFYPKPWLSRGIWRTNVYEFLLLSHKEHRDGCACFSPSEVCPSSWAYPWMLTIALVHNEGHDLYAISARRGGADPSSFELCSKLMQLRTSQNFAPSIQWNPWSCWKLKIASKTILVFRIWLNLYYCFFF